MSQRREQDAALLGRSGGAAPPAMRKKRRPHSSRAPGSPRREGPRRWRLGEDGGIANFSFRALREDVLLRLRCDELYTLEECKVLLKEMLKYAGAWCEVELAQLMYLGELRNRLLPDQRIEFQWPASTIPDIPLDPGAGDVSAVQNPRYKIGKIVEELNKSLIRVADTLLQQRKERLLLGARILEDLEQVDALALAR
eukprot:TRINITY_DN1635_c0_g1_i1.p1 TRINITY_DN1635_c0_g1~~TRINITY_DN1635_c0_g1_i1.p1  ORF type:complete len:224 (+),score=99.39 TRINITY_DN1635_c0_g1_i1:82-672(+)